MYDNIMVYSILRLMAYPSPRTYKWIKDRHQGLEVNAAAKTMLGMKKKIAQIFRVGERGRYTVWSDADTHTNADMDNFKMHFYIWSHPSNPELYAIAKIHCMNYFSSLNKASPYSRFIIALIYSLVSTVVHCFTGWLQLKRPRTQHCQ